MYKVRSIRTVSVRHSSIYDVKIEMGRTVEAMNWGLLRDILRIRKLVGEYYIEARHRGDEREDGEEARQLSGERVQAAPTWNSRVSHVRLICLGSDGPD